MKFPDSKITKKLQNMKESFETSKGYEEKPTDAKLIKKLAIESLNLPPKMREIDIDKRENISRDLLNMIDDMVSAKKTITQYYDLSTVLVDPNADPKIIDTSERQDEIPSTPKSPTLPKPRIKIIKRLQTVDKIEEKALTNKKNHDKSSSDNKNFELELNDNKIQNDVANATKTNKLIDIFDENLNKNKNNGNQYKENEKFDMDLLDYTEMDIESTVHDNTSEKSNNDLQINENNDTDVICSDSVEDTSRSSRKKVTSTSNDIGAANNDITSPDNDNSSPNNDNSTLNNEHSNPDNDNSPPSNENIPPNDDKSSPNNGNNVVDSTQNNNKHLDNDTYNYQVMIMKMLLARLSITFNSIYEFM